MIKIPGRIPILIHPIFWLLAGGIGWLNSYNFITTAIWMAVIFISVLIHEYGHALTAMAFGQRSVIELLGFGGLTVRHGRQPKLWQEFLIIFNGPLAGLLLGALAWLILPSLYRQHPSGWLTYGVTIAVYINFFWTFVNLLPIQPLDGGKLFSILMEGAFGLKGVKTSLFLSIVLAGGLGLLLFVMHAFLAGSLFFLFAYESYKSWKSSLLVMPEDKDDALQRLLQDAERAKASGEVLVAIDKAKQLRREAKQGVLYSKASELLAGLLVQRGEEEEAYAILQPLGSHLSDASLVLLHRLAFRKGEWQQAIALGDRLYRRRPDDEVALINALCYGALGEVHPATEWLRCALADERMNASSILAKKEFDAIRKDPLFQQLQSDLHLH